MCNVTATFYHRALKFVFFILLIPYAFSASNFNANAGVIEAFRSCGSTLARVSTFKGFRDRTLDKSGVPWSFTSAEEQGFLDIIHSTGSLNERISDLAQSILYSRLELFPPEVAERIKLSWDNIGHEVSREKKIGFITFVFSETKPAAHPVSLKITESPAIRNTPLGPIFNIHEAEHIRQLVEMGRTRVAWRSLEALLQHLVMPIRSPHPIFQRMKIEAEAIGAEWEVLSRIPDSLREEMKAVIQNKLAGRFKKPYEKIPPDVFDRIRNGPYFDSSDVESSFLVLALDMLDNAHLPKRIFVDNMLKHHGYTLSRLFLHYYVPSGPISGFIKFAAFALKLSAWGQVLTP